jgi:ABC-type Fe3+/spermidine/putrescine transport system ATPase subunit
MVVALGTTIPPAVPPMSQGAALEVQHLSRRYGAVQAVGDVSFELAQGETICLLGPSGCGKSTTLRVIAGLEEPDPCRHGDGVVRLRGRTVASAREGFSLPPNKRNIGLVFQSYAVWPHMTVFENVAYPLRARRVAGNEIRRRVHESLDMVGLENLADRRATQLSGGQQQRVALARSLIYEPDLLLLDEPLSNLDFRRRQAMRTYLKDLQRRLGITVLFVTHDRIEAMTLSHKIAVMRDGWIEDLGTPDDMYRSAKTRFVYDFLGNSVNLVGSVVRERGGRAVQVGSSRIPFADDASGVSDGETVVASMRPESVTIEIDTSSTSGPIRAVLDDVSFLGDHLECSLRIADQTLILDAPVGTPLRVGADVVLSVEPSAVRVWPRGASN